MKLFLIIISILSFQLACVEVEKSTKKYQRDDKGALSTLVDEGDEEGVDGMPCTIIGKKVNLQEGDISVLGLVMLENSTLEECEEASNSQETSQMRGTFQDAFYHQKFYGETALYEPRLYRLCGGEVFIHDGQDDPFNNYPDFYFGDGAIYPSIGPIDSLERCKRIMTNNYGCDKGVFDATYEFGERVLLTDPFKIVYKWFDTEFGTLECPGR